LYERYNRWLQSKMQGTSWLLSRNYFTSPTGKVVTQWPFGAFFYGVLVKTLGRFSETDTTRAGSAAVEDRAGDECRSEHRASALGHDPERAASYRPGVR
jgi:hypothetical protein